MRTTLMKKLKIAACILTIFVFGVITGTVGTYSLFKYRIHKTMSQSGHPAMGALLRMVRSVNLTQKQQQELNHILAEMKPKWRDLLEAHKPRTKALFQESYEEMRAILNPEQKHDFEKAMARLQKRAKKLGFAP